MESTTMEGAAVCMQDHLQAQAMEKLHRAYRDECQRQMRRNINARWMRKHMGGEELSLEPLPSERFCLHGAAALEAYFEHPDAGEQVVLLW